MSARGADDREETRGARGDERPADLGIRCPSCGCAHFRVLATRAAALKRTMRRRECRNCGKRVTTYERL